MLAAQVDRYGHRAPLPLTQSQPPCRRAIVWKGESLLQKNWTVSPRTAVEGAVTSAPRHQRRPIAIVLTGAFMIMVPATMKSQSRDRARRVDASMR